MTPQYTMDHLNIIVSKIVSEYDQEIPQSQTADKPMAPRGRATQLSDKLSKAITSQPEMYIQKVEQKQYWTANTLKVYSL